MATFGKGRESDGFDMPLKKGGVGAFVPPLSFGNGDVLLRWWNGCHAGSGEDLGL